MDPKLLRFASLEEWRKASWAPNGQFEKLTWYPLPPPAAPAEAGDEAPEPASDPGPPVIVAMLRSCKGYPTEARLAMMREALAVTGAGESLSSQR